MNNRCNKCGNHVNNCGCIKYRVIAKFDNGTRIYEDKMYSLLGHTEAEWVKIFEEVLGFDEHQAKSTLYRTINSKNYGDCYEGLVYIRTAWERMQERKSKMTREEASRIALNAIPADRTIGANVLGVLEALGLIKFEEVKSKELHYDVASDITVGETNGKVYVRRGTTVLWTEK